MKTNRPHSKQGFTLIELLTVIAIIGILAGIIIPTVGAVRENAMKTKTKTLFSQWASAMELFRQDYGYYPTFGGDAGKIDINGVPFEETLTGEDTTYNKKERSYHTFSQDAFDDPDSDDRKLIDAFGNEKIFMAVDSDFDGEIDSDDHGPVRGSVIFYTEKDDATGAPEIKSWE